MSYDDDDNDHDGKRREWKKNIGMYTKIHTTRGRQFAIPGIINAGNGADIPSNKKFKAPQVHRPYTFTELGNILLVKFLDDVIVISSTSSSAAFPRESIIDDTGNG